jgi:methyl-accepting chemotaxis protein
MGFAVVAEEVRNLAGRSAQAAKDTTVIIESNIELSSKGVSAAEKVHEALTEITSQAKKVNELMSEISAATQEQSQGIGQVNQAIVQMENVTQQNAAGAEQSASAAEELNAQADSMKKIVQELSELMNGATNALYDNRVTPHRLSFKP